MTTTTPTEDSMPRMTVKTVGNRSYSPELVAETLYDYLVGRLSHKLSDSERFAVYVEADGFGDCRNDRDWLVSYTRHGYDWSHVRDSSDEAMLRAFDTLVATVKGRS
jgi:hypothetical protein